ncbi:hypothetical protein Mal48_15580 [Thalassoglobus polymorphus]|uniref:Uncharacterized protein n=1 Tax=Thalassoglobus polymorphus TaxID=2527994 RepID=A0A517QKZ5_9PLAN|nr:hypothetical protein Mal48_15580 [Thalassoglobus polymorphus]
MRLAFRRLPFVSFHQRAILGAIMSPRLQKLGRADRPERRPARPWNLARNFTLELLGFLVFRNLPKSYQKVFSENRIKYYKK